MGFPMRRVQFGPRLPRQPAPGERADAVDRRPAGAEAGVLGGALMSQDGTDSPPANANAMCVNSCRSTARDSSVSRPRRKGVTTIRGAE